MEQEKGHDEKDEIGKDDRGEKTFAIPGDAPIIVGGGGSTIVWIKKSTFDKKLTDAERDALAAMPGVQAPSNVNLYDAYRCNFDAKAAVVRPDGSIRGVRHSHMDPTTHATSFHEMPLP